MMSKGPIKVHERHMTSKGQPLATNEQFILTTSDEQFLNNIDSSINNSNDITDKNTMNNTMGNNMFDNMLPYS